MNTNNPHESNDFFYPAYGQTPPWDIGAPQPELLALLDEFPATGPVLEVGCGTGALALALAELGFNVLGVDLAENAINQARARAAAAPPEVARLVAFNVGDALHPSQFHGPFGAVVDSGFFHLFEAGERKHFVAELAATLKEGGRYYLLGFAINSPLPNAPRQVLESELRELFPSEQGWRILVLRPAEFLIRSARSNQVPAIAACIERVSMS